jgi:plastocyanin
MKKAPYFILPLLLSMPMVAFAQDYLITVKEGVFAPAETTIPAGQKIKVTVKNIGVTPAEFESYDLNREKIIPAKSEVIVFIGPLEKGTYTYFDDFHQNTPKGSIKAE